MIKKYYKLAIIVLLTIGIGVSTYYNYKQSRDWMQLNNEKSDVFTKNIQISQEIEQLKEENNKNIDIISKGSNIIKQEAMRNLMLSEMNEFFAYKIDELDKILQDTDDISTDLLNWFIENARFSDNDLNIAEIKIENYKIKHSDYVEKYDILFTEIYDKLDSLDTMQD